MFFRALTNFNVLNIQLKFEDELYVQLRYNVVFKNYKHIPMYDLIVDDYFSLDI